MDLSESDEIIKTARIFIGQLAKHSMTAESKKELSKFLEEVIKSRQQVTKGNQHGTTMEADQANDGANRFNAIEQKLDELKTITETNSAKLDELKTVVTTTSERTYAQVTAAAATLTQTPNVAGQLFHKQDRHLG